METWRYLEGDAVGAARGLAVDEALMARYQRGESSDDGATLRLYTYRPHCALVGRYQSLEDEVDLDFCARQGFGVSRRPTGGGAIIMGPGQLGVAITAAARADETPRQALARFSRGVVAGLAALGIEASFRSKNDLEVGGRKIAGLGLYLDPAGALLFHASVLIDLDIPLMLETLRIPGAKLSDKAAALVGERVTTVSRELGRPVELSAAREFFSTGIPAALGARTIGGELTAAENRRVTELVEQRYGNSEWIGQRSPRRNARGSAVLKTPQGLLRLYVGLQGPALKSVLITGDFNFLPRVIPRLESALKWCPAEPARIHRIVSKQLTASSDAGALADPREIADAVWRAVERARVLESSAHPQRLDGSCYFPDPASQRPVTSEENTP